MPENFIQELQDKVHQTNISADQQLSEDFITEDFSPYDLLSSDTTLGLKCFICLIKQSYTFVGTKCSHIFHKEYVYKWLKTYTTCLMCRSELIC